MLTGSLKLAVLGASGFIGWRTVELLHLTNLASVRPIVRNFSRLAPLTRFDLDCRLADAFDKAALRDAFSGCDVVLHAIAGDPKTILDTLTPAYQAAQESGVRRLVYLSTAAVHGQAPEPGSDEESPLNDHQALPYNNAKVKAERRLRKLRQSGDVEMVVLRPGIVFGPRSSWVAHFADSLLSGTAYLIDRGEGICNTIYIDNLVHAIYLAATASDVDGDTFLVGDDETVTWADLYEPIAQALGFNLEQIPEAVLYGTSRVASWHRADLQRPVASLEMTMLFQCQYKLPDTKARTKLGYKPPVSFVAGCQRSVAWLGRAGYPVGLKNHKTANTDNPLVSVVIIFLNAERFLAEAIASIFDQTYERWELLLVNDGSSDCSSRVARQYAEQYPEKVSYLEHDGGQNRGMSASRNLGIRHAQGDYIAFLDADDVWLPHKLMQQVAILEAHPTVTMVYGRTLIWHSWAASAKQDYTLDLGVSPNRMIEPPTLFMNLLRNNVQTPTTCNAMIRRDVFDKIGCFEEQFRGMYEDQAFFAKVELAAPVYVADTCWAKYRQHPESCSSFAEKTQRYADARLPFLTWLNSYVTEQQPDTNKQIRRVLKQELWRCYYPRLSQVLTWLWRMPVRMRQMLTR